VAISQLPDFSVLEDGDALELDAFAAISPKRKRPAYCDFRHVPDSELLYDKDGLVIPEPWRPWSWEKQSLEVRRRLSAKYMAKPLAPEKKPRAARSPGSGKAFTTQAGVTHYKRTPGWTYRAREGQVTGKRFTGRLDLPMGADIQFSSAQGMIAIQCGQPGEEKAHRLRFERDGGVQGARECGYCRFIWAEFVRGNPVPAREADWL
jgi:hypothetical protein